ncbi:MAG TPA: hypothetical protein VMV28_03305 [Thermoplasmata archaeon]|nr:hypothetical protein [Thermoplasmata archaeon]
MSRGRPASEHELAGPVRRHLEALGYRVWVDPDGRDYFDVVAKRNEEVGLVELKLADGPRVFAQALRRRAWGDWVAVAVASERSAERLMRVRTTPLARRVGIWLVRGDTVDVRRGSQPWSGSDAPYEAERRGFRAVLDRLASGEIPAGVEWGGIGRMVRHASGGRGFAEFTIEELTRLDGPDD